MNTIVASWHWRFRNRIGRLGLRIERLGQRMSAWAKAKKQQEEDMELKPEVKRELLAMMEDTSDESPAFDTVEEFVAHLKNNEEDSDS